jgi:hypothetical protein
MSSISVFPANLVIRGKEDAKRFYACVKSVHLIPYNRHYLLRIEPNNCFTVIAADTLALGLAWMIPSTCDEDGTLAFNYRKYINAWLRT